MVSYFKLGGIVNSLCGNKKIKNIWNALASSYPTDLPEGLLLSLKTDIKSVLVITEEVFRTQAWMSYFTLKAVFKL